MSMRNPLWTDPGRRRVRLSTGGDYVYHVGMTNLAKMVTELNGWPGAPGVNVHYFSQGTWASLGADAVQEAYDELYDVYTALVPYLREGTTVKVATGASVIDVGTGEMVDYIPVGSLATDVTAVGGSKLQSAAVQAVVRFNTDAFIRGRRLIGRSFIGPIASSCMNTDGEIKSESRSGIDDMWESLTSGNGPRLAVYQRPSPANSNVGTYGDVASAVCQARSGVLRSRRD